MRVLRVNQFVFLLNALVSVSALATSKEYWRGPFFWQQKEAIHERMRTQRYIPVSVLRNSSDWSIKGAGLVKAEASFVFDYAKDFNHLKKYTEIFQTVDWDEKAQELTVIPKFFSGSLRAKMKIWTVVEKGTQGSAPQDSLRRIHFQVLEGPFKNAEGALLIAEVSRQECEVGLVSVYSGLIVAFGNDLMAVAMEGALHSLASSLRQAVEEAWLQKNK